MLISEVVGCSYGLSIEDLVTLDMNCKRILEAQVTMHTLKMVCHISNFRESCLSNDT